MKITLKIKMPPRFVQGICLCFALWFLFILPTAADEGETNQFLQQQLDNMGISEVEEAVPPQARQLLEQINLSQLSLKEILALSPQEFWQVLKNSIKDAFTQPAKIFGKILGILLLCGLMSQVKGAVFQGDMDHVFSVVSILCMVSFLAKPITECIMKTVESLHSCSLFILSFIPVLSSILAASGQPTAASGYHFMLFAVCQGVSKISAEVLAPCVGIYFALCIISALFPQIGLQGITTGMKNIVCWGLGALTTVFVGVLSMQTLVSIGMDSLAIKTSKFLMGSFIPVVGGVLSDAFTAAQGCLKVLRGTVGSFGIITAFFTFLPVLAKVVVWYVIVNIAAEIGNMLSAPQAAAVLKGTGTTLSILIALIMCFVLLLIISTALVLMIGAG